jgi:adenylate kinase
LKKLIYLTGAPATGKSTLTENLRKRLPEANVFTYSKQLLTLVEGRSGLTSTQDDLRRQSSNIITREDIEKLDKQLLSLADSCRGHQNLVIDSHPVTIEEYGFRVTPFTKDQIKKLAPDVIVCLYAKAVIIAGRISKNAEGRPLPAPSEIDMHTQLQCQVASIYAIETGASLHFLDADHPPEALLDNFMHVTKID